MCPNLFPLVLLYFAAAHSIFLEKVLQVFQQRHLIFCEPETAIVLLRFREILVSAPFVEG
jgi:hypothetical protein